MLLLLLLGRNNKGDDCLRRRRRRARGECSNKKENNRWNPHHHPLSSPFIASTGSIPVLGYVAYGMIVPLFPLLVLVDPDADGTTFARFIVANKSSHISRHCRVWCRKIQIGSLRTTQVRLLLSVNKRYIAGEWLYRYPISYIRYEYGRQSFVTQDLHTSE